MSKSYSWSCIRTGGVPAHTGSGSVSAALPRVWGPRPPLLTFLQIPLLALNLKGIEYEYKSVAILNKNEREQKLEDVNPYEQVPVLVIKGSGEQDKVLIQSLAIIQYLDEVYPQNPLLPGDAYARAQSRAIADCICSGIQPLQNIGLLDMIKEKGGDHIRWAHDVIDSRFADLEKIMKNTAGKCCVGDTVTLADLCLVPQVFNAKRFGVDMNRFTLISRICAHLESLEAFQLAHPDKMADAPGNLPDPD